MKTWHQSFSREAFAAPPQVRDIGGWRVEFLGFSGPAVNRPPLICIGGAFQSRWSFRHVAERLLPLMPVVVVDLPGQGNNSQDSQALGFAGFADVLAGFCRAEGLQRVVPLGLSYGSAIAHAFACAHPQSVEKLILGGTSAQLRKTVVATLRHGLSLIGDGEREAFATGAVMHLLNHSKRAATGISDRLVERMFESIRDLDEAARRRYRANTERLLGHRMSGNPGVPTLVLVGEFDSFTSPAECHEVAQMIPGARFAVVAGADHLVPLQRQEVEIQLYRAFLSGDRTLEQVEGLRTLDRLPGERRVFDRHDGAGSRLRVRIGDRQDIEVVLKDGSAAGLSFETPVEFPCIEGPFEVEIGDRRLLAHAYETGAHTRAAVIMTSMPAQQLWEAKLARLPSRTGVSSGAQPERQT